MNSHIRHTVLGGLSGLLAASAYNATVPAEATAQVTDDQDGSVQTVTSPRRARRRHRRRLHGRPDVGLTPPGTTQQEALTYDAGSRAALPVTSR
ncbi:hypothetical protein [Halorubellus sp. PRR65]|uniref:hypothetical protein n=1 Tax=Halorubellus sp. PRR65 TaxID=3098148 RepID=UPI002B263B19|nr:hypothetical protein [Halorubellus sp. PRR65]